MIKKILFADDHWIVRDSLKHVFRQLGSEFEALEASDYEGAIGLLKSENDIGLVVVDLIMPGFDDFDGLKSLRRMFPDVPVIVLSVQDDRRSVMRCIELGVVGYVPKTAEAKELAHALERVLSGDVYFPRDILANRDAEEQTSSTTAGPSASRMQVLTSREREVVLWMGRGMSDAKIAEGLKLSPNTVRVHIKNIMQKLGLANRAETIHFAVTIAQGPSGPHVQKAG